MTWVFPKMMNLSSWWCKHVPEGSIFLTNFQVFGILGKWRKVISWDQMILNIRAGHTNSSGSLAALFQHEIAGRLVLEQYKYISMTLNWIKDMYTYLGTNQVFHLGMTWVLKCWATWDLNTLKFVEFLSVYVAHEQCLGALHGIGVSHTLINGHFRNRWRLEVPIPYIC